MKLEQILKPVEERVDSAGQQGNEEDEAENDRDDDVNAPVGAGEIAAVDVGAGDAEDDEENESDDRDREQDLKSEICPGRKGSVLTGWLLIVVVHGCSFLNLFLLLCFLRLPKWLRTNEDAVRVL